MRVAGVLEGVKKIRAKLQALPFCNRERLTRRKVVLLISRRTLRAHGRRAEGILLRRGIGAQSVVPYCAGRIGEARHSRGIRTKPIIQAAVSDDQLTVVIRPRSTVVDVRRVRTVDGNR